MGVIVNRVKHCISFLVSLFAMIVKRDRGIVLCTGWYGYRFADNSRYMYLYLHDHKKELGMRHVVWITKDMAIYKELKDNGYEVCMKKSLKSIYYHIRACCFFYDQFLLDFFSMLTPRAKCVCLWHGLPIKKFGLLNGLKGEHWNLGDNYLLTSSAFGDQTLGMCFDVQKEHLIHGMYPRDFYLLHDIPFLLEQERFFLQQLDEIREKGKKIIFYLPTFRKNTSLEFLGETDSVLLDNFFQFLEEQDYFLLSKVHFHGVDLHGDRIGFSYNNFLNLPPELDINPFLKVTDILLTDYSSVLFDFLYLGREIICFPYDLKEYKEHDQGLLLDYESLPVSIVNSLEELKACLLQRDSRLSKRKEQAEWLSRCFGDMTMEDTVKLIFA